MIFIFVSVCVFVPIDLNTAGPIIMSFTLQLFIGPGRVSELNKENINA